jgi:peptide/nickel transport system permease protein
MLEALRSDFVTVARAKGLRETAVVMRHVFRNAMLPVVTILGLSLARVLSGAVIVETMFGWPGMGKLGVDATIQRDYPLLMGVVLLSGVTILVGNLLVDVVYASIDPRIAYD